MSKVPVSYDQLCGLADHARRVGTLDAFADVALQWAGEADKEIKRLTEWNRQMVEKAASGGRLDGYRELADRAAAAEIERDELRRQLDECSQMLARQAATIHSLTRPAEES